MAAPLLVIIQGAPGVGKTTLLEKLRQDFTMPMLGKDEIKEFLFDITPQSSREPSYTQSDASFAMLYAFAHAFLAKGHPVLIEGAFYSKVAGKVLQEILDSTGAQCLELLCYVDEAVRQKRFNARSESGSRHAVHASTMAKELPRGGFPHVTLNLGDRIDIDTSEPLEPQHEYIVSEIKRRLA